MAPSNQPNFNQSGTTPHSKLDLLSGKHTTSLIVAILFLITLICLIVVVCVKDIVPENLVTGLTGLLGVLAGFFAGTKFNGDN
ncbi:hypothetical protein ACFSR6_12985 [Pedobacter vanadiisoli]|uniref:Uncharacterized protein n=1 Tax=Pedobacter vanadiisoli TaxID=1761975 RepID=A0ABW5MJK8_9SPHI